MFLDIHSRMLASQRREPTFISMTNEGGGETDFCELVVESLIEAEAGELHAVCSKGAS